MTIPPSIEFHRRALLRVLGGLFVLAGMVPGGAIVARLPVTVQTVILRALRPAQSAARRLVFAVARGMDAVTVTSRAGPGGLVPRGDGGGDRIPAFPLFDRRKYFAELVPQAQRKPRARGAGPRILFLNEAYPVAGGGKEKPAREPEDARRICREMASLQRALDSLHRQARRMNRAMARRAKAPPGPGRAGPLRPGMPPGGRRHPVLYVDTLLNECDRLARTSVAPARASP